MLAAVDWHVVWGRIGHPDHAFFRALYTTVYMAVIAQAMGVVLGLFAALMRSSKLAPMRFLSGVYEIFADAEIHYSNSFQPVEYFLAVAFWYLVLTTVWTFIQAAIERKLAASERGEELSFRERVIAAWNPVTSWAKR